MKDQHYLRLIENDVHGIAERLNRRDSDWFVVYNLRHNRYELHSLANKGGTLSLILPFKQLDARCEDYVLKRTIGLRGKKIFREMDEHNEELEKSIKRQRSNDIRGIAEEMAPYFRKTAQEVY